MFALELKDMRWADQMVLNWLYQRIDEERGECLITQDEIMEAVGCCRRTVVYVTRRLEAAGKIEVDRTSRRRGNLFKRGNNA